MLNGWALRPRPVRSDLQLLTQVHSNLLGQSRRQAYARQDKAEVACDPRRSSDPEGL